MPTPPITAAEFKAQFPREFIYGSSPDRVMDADITRAMTEARMVFSTALWADDTEIDTAFGYAAAHFLVLNLQAAGGLSAQNFGSGVQSRGGGAIAAKSVGGVSVTYALPESITGSAILSGFMRTDFGMRYLQMLTPRLVAPCFAVEGYSENAGLEDTTLPDQNIFTTGNFDVSADGDVLAYGAAQVHYFFNVMALTDGGARILFPRSGTIKGLMVKAVSNTLSGATTITVMKNGAATALTCALAVAAVDSQDAVDTFQIAAGDTVSIKVDITASATGVLTGLIATLVLQ